jgi:5-methylthioadenosine/S-adenosylhomocysteine deaminase
MQKLRMLRRTPTGWRSLMIAAALFAVPIAAQAPRAVDLIVANGIIVTMDGPRRVLTSGSVAIAGSSIVAVDAADRIARDFKAAQVIDAAGRVVMPGLINTHTHAPMVLYRGLGDDLALMDWLQKYIFPAEAKTVSPAFVRTGTRLAALEDDDLYRHVLLRGGHRARDARGRPPRSPGPDGDRVSCA